MAEPATPATEPAPTAFKDWFNAARYRALADLLAAEAPGFDRRRFLACTLEGLEERELMDRLRQTATACEVSLSGTYREKVAVLRAIAARLDHGFVAIALCDFVARYGLEEAAFSLDALRFLTRFGSSEFAVRPFIARDPQGTLAEMLTWTRDDNEHVRRLASEGSRPRLPWGQRLQALIADPTLTAPILEALKADPALYVRKSVANHLNDLAKDHPELVIARVGAWDRTNPGTDWIVGRALRTLVKKGVPAALALVGATAGARLDVERFAVAPARLRLGGRLRLEARLRSTGRAAQNFVVDYVVHYVRARGATSEKVFKWTRVELAAGATVDLEKSQVIEDLSIRKHYPGVHRVELQVNGRRVAEGGFRLTSGR
jgi:3-methyladenine DNA glycosylase AlkC